MDDNPPFYVEVMWRREFLFMPRGGPVHHLQEAIIRAQVTESLGDGAAVKKARVVDSAGRVVYANGPRTLKP